MRRSVRLRLSAVMAVAGGMAIATVAALIWGLQVRSWDPAGFRGDQGIMATPFVPSWIVVMVGLATATVLAALASRRQLAASRGQDGPFRRLRQPGVGPCIHSVS